MKKLLLLLMFVATAVGQISFSGGVKMNNVTVGMPGIPVPPPPEVMPQLPLAWVNPQECNPPGGVYDVTKTVKASGGTYTPSQFNTAISDWVNSGVDQWEHLVVDPGLLITGQIIINQKTVAGNAPTKCLVVESSNALTTGRLVCAHGFTDAAGPEPGTRNPGCTTDIAQMYTIESKTTSSALLWNPGANHVVLRDIELRENATSPQHNSALVQMGQGNSNQSTIASIPNHIGLDRAYIHGYDPGDTLTKLGIASITRASNVVTVSLATPMSQAYVNPLRVNISGVTDTSFNGTAFTVNSGATTTTFSYNQTGANATSTGGQAFSTDATNLTRAIANHCNSCWIINSYIEKIHDENNQSQGITGFNMQGPGMIVHNWIEGASEGVFWGGSSAVVKVNNESIFPADYEVRDNRVTLDPNYINLSAGTGVLGSSCQPNCVNHFDIANRIETKTVQRLLVDGNIFEYSWKDAQVGAIALLNVRTCSSGPCTGNENGAVTDVTFNNNILRHGAEAEQNDARSDGSSAGQGVSFPIVREIQSNNLIYDVVRYATWGGAGNALDRLVTFSNSGNQFGCTATRDSLGLTVTMVCNSILNLTSNTFNGLLQMFPGDPVLVSNCTNNASTGFNTDPTMFGPAVLTVTQSPGATTASITYTQAGPANATDSCTLANKQGWPQYITWEHNAGYAGDNLRFALQTSTGIFARNITYVGSIAASLASSGNNQEGWWTSGLNEGTPSESQYDTGSLALHDNVFFNRLAASYTEYPGGFSPPQTIYFPTTFSCAIGSVVGGVYPSTCLGLAGFSNGETYPPSNYTTTFNYHDLSLCKNNGNSDYGVDARCKGASIFDGGQAKASRVGEMQNALWFSMGPDIKAIENHQVQNQYVCMSDCGSGPFPVNPTGGGGGGGTVALFPASATVEFTTVQTFSPWVNSGSGSQAGTWSVLGGGAGGTIDSVGNYTAPASGASDTVQFHSTATGTNVTATVTLSGSLPTFTIPVGNDGQGTMQHDGVSRGFYLYEPPTFTHGTSGVIIQLTGNDTVGSGACTGANGTSGQETFYWKLYSGQITSNAPLFVCPDPMYYKNSSNVCLRRNADYAANPVSFFNNDATCTSAAITPNDSDYVKQLILMAIKQFNVNPKKVWISGLWNNGSPMAQKVAIENSQLIAAVAQWEYQPPLRTFGCSAYPSPPANPVSFLTVEGSGSTDANKICGSNATTCAGGTPGDLNPQATIDDQMTFLLPSIGNPGTNTSSTFCSGGPGSVFTSLQERHSLAGTLGAQIQQYSLIGGISITYCSVLAGCPGTNQGPYIDFTLGTGTSVSPKNTSMTSTTGKDMDTVIYNFFLSHVRP